MSQPSLPDGNKSRNFAEARAEAAWARFGEGGWLLVEAEKLLARAERDWRRAPEVVAAALRDARGLPSAERRLLGEAVHGWIRMRRRLAWLCGTSDVATTLRAWLALYSPAPATKTEALRDVAELAAIADPVERLGVTTSYPDWLVARVVAAYGDEAEALLEAMNHRAPLTVRANRVRGDRDTLAAQLAALEIPSRPTALASDGLVLATHLNVYGLQPFRDGAMEMQDEGSQLIAEVVAPPPRGVIVDACAGAGGKTLALGALLANQGRIVALDITERKLVELRKRARRAGLSNITARLAGSGPKVAPADRVLVDAPCSGSGVVRRNPETRWRLQPGEIAPLTALQGRLLDEYSSLVRPGGRLIYATCSIFPEENDAVFEAFLARHPDFEPVPVKEVLGKPRALAIGDGDRLRTLPHRHDTDGFFAAIARRR